MGHICLGNTVASFCLRHRSLLKGKEGATHHVVATSSHLRLIVSDPDIFVVFGVYFSIINYSTKVLSVF
jgi:hypothetical protein